MVFNLKKQSQKTKNSVLPLATAIPKSVDKYNLSLKDKEFIPNFNEILETDRRPIKDAVTHEAMLDESRKKAAKNEKIIEGELADSDSPLYPHRQIEDGKGPSVMPINSLSEAFDRKYRDAFAKANNDPNTSFWDKYVGVQLDDKPTKVPNNVPESGSQLHSSPDRFGNLDGLPHESSAIKNRENFGKEVKIKPMQGFKGNEKPIELTMTSLKNADKIIFATYYAAAKENRDLNAEEKELINDINLNKQSLLTALAQGTPQIVPPVQDGAVPVADRETDFLNGNDPTAGDHHLWGEMSGHDPALADIGSEDRIPTTNADSVSLETGEPEIPGMGDTLPALPGATNEISPVSKEAEPTSGGQRSYFDLLNNDTQPVQSNPRIPSDQTPF